ncbi:hypothetical protein EV359DRAFT_62665 [Lentinula novae-zelandiae]|nr:hypothetical protein EV359DRAFT_62665 [Lentinula novae-zelandiae]
MAGRGNYGYPYNFPGQGPPGNNPNAPPVYNPNAPPGHNPNVPPGHNQAPPAYYPNAPPGANYGQYQAHYYPGNTGNYTGYVPQGYPAPPGGNVQGAYQQTGNTAAFPHVPAAQGAGAGPTQGATGWQGPAFDRAHETSPRFQGFPSGLGHQRHANFQSNSVLEGLPLTLGQLPAGAVPPSYNYARNEGPLHSHGYSPPSPEVFNFHPQPQRGRTAQAPVVPGVPVPIHGGGLRRHGQLDDTSSSGSGSGDHVSDKSNQSTDENKYVVGHLSLGSHHSNAVGPSTSRNIVPTANGFKKCPVCSQVYVVSDEDEHSCPGNSQSARKEGNNNEKAGKDKGKGK